VYLSLVSFVTPVVAVMFGTMILGEELSSRVFVGAAFVLTGILAANGEIILRAMRRNTSLDGN
jgi:drug/metabolite transporter (DMT)-like permease